MESGRDRRAGASRAVTIDDTVRSRSIRPAWDGRHRWRPREGDGRAEGSAIRAVWLGSGASSVD